MSPPLVSICVPTYNHVHFIGDALRSALEQDYPNLEIIAADDGSTDGTAAVILQLVKNHPGRIVALPSRANQGIAGMVTNYNRALAACHGKYIAFLEGDDLYLPGKISTQVQWLESNPRRVLCGHDVEAFDSASGRTLYRWSEQWPLRSGRGAYDVIRYQVPFCTVSVMLRASAVPPRGFDDRLRIVLDWKFWIDCLSADGEFGHVAGVFARYRRHPGNVTAGHFQARQDDQFITLGLVESRHPHFAECCRFGRARLFYGMGVDCLARGDIRAARIHFWNAYRHRARSQGRALLALALTFLPAGWTALLLDRLKPGFRSSKTT